MTVSALVFLAAVRPRTPQAGNKSLMDLNHPLARLLHVIESYQIDASKFEVQQAFEDTDRQEFEIWVQELLSYETLLTKEEAAL